ncbi:MAG: hypothetical protein FVQ79_00615 [Planctomycetes bacterium]|nr:hypothetical protein [Planctomycetota bacterium]
MKILGINGVGTHGSDTTDVLLHELAKLGHETIDANYRTTRLFRFQTYDRGRQFEDALFIANNYWEPDCAVIAHSRGGLVLWRMLEIGFHFSTIFLFRPAINKDFILPLHQVYMNCIYRPDDRAIKWASRLPFNDFGNAGRFGIDDDRVINIRADRYLNSEFWKHSDDFMYPQVAKWATFIDGRMKTLQ